MTGPRNKKRYLESLAHREQIKAVLLERAKHPLLRPLSGKQLQARFPHLGLSTVQAHLAKIHEAAEAEANSLEIV